MNAPCSLNFSFPSAPVVPGVQLCCDQEQFIITILLSQHKLSEKSFCAENKTYC